MTDRTLRVTEFLRECGWSAAAREVLAGDASNRSYERLYDDEDNQSVVLMKTPPEAASSVKAFVKVTKILQGFGLSVPKTIHCDYENGLLLIEDLGDALFARICSDHSTMEQQIYEVAIDLLVVLHSHPVPAGLPFYDIATYRREAMLLVQWYLPAVTGGPVSKALTDQFDNLIADCCEKIPQAQQVLVLRDFHAENLLWLPERSATNRIGLLDYQDALIGNPAYDIMSLLEDARRHTADKLQRDMKRRYLDATGHQEAAFGMSYSILGMQRNLKILGIFMRLCTRDGKFTYLDLLPRVWRHIQRDLSHPALSEMRQWVNKHVPEPTLDNVSKIREKLNAA